MIKLNKDYLSIAKSERQRHLDLNPPCLERGGNSTNHRGVLAQFLNTEISGEAKVVLAHACNNGKCSNPLHLYWASFRENTVEDGIKFGTWKPYFERAIEKYGYEEACRLNARGDKSAGGSAGKGSKKPRK